MRVFWGKYCPDEAVFHCPGFFSGIPQRIKNLPPPRRTKAVKRTFLPEKEQWFEMVEAALDAIASGEVEKVVLARTIFLELSESPDPFAIAAALQEKAEGALLFCMADERRAFLGASPEHLFTRTGRFIETEAMAGTCWGDRAFGEKEMRELEPVQRFLNEALAPLCEYSIAFSPVRIHKMHHLQHLRSTCRGHLKNGITDGEIATRLHPTPALSGLPQKNALDLIRKLEPFERGLYGSFIGWSTENASEHIVTIRSCFLEGNRARLSTGAGIVAGSDAETEWEELDQKLKLFEGILL